MPLSREIRRLQNIKELSISSGDTKITGSHAPSSLNMRDGEMVFAQESNKPLSMYKKYKGMLWKSHMSRDGNEFVDKDLEVKGKTTLRNDLTVGGELKGTRLIFNFGTAVASYVDSYMKTVNGVIMSSNLGYVMHRAGSIVGAGARFQCTTFANNETWSVDVLVDDSSVFKPTGVTVDGTGYYSTYGIQARGADTFGAGGLIQVKMNQASGLNKAEIDNVIGYFEVVFDN